MARVTLGLAGLILLASCATVPQLTPAARSELAPTGTLRVGINYGNALFASRDPITGEPRGIAIDLARELGRSSGIPLELVGYSSAGQLTAAMKSGAWDVAFLAFDPARAAVISYTAAFAEVESTYLVPPASALRTVADVDRDGVRIAVSAKGGNDLFLSRTLKHARLVRVPGAAAAFKLFVSDRLEAYAGLKPQLLADAARLPGSRVLEGSYTVVGYSVGTPKGRKAGAQYLAEFIEEAKLSGLVARAIEKNGIRGVSAAPTVQPTSTLQIGGGVSTSGPTSY